MATTRRAKRMTISQGIREEVRPVVSPAGVATCDIRRRFGRPETLGTPEAARTALDEQLGISPCCMIHRNQTSVHNRQ